MKTMVIALGGNAIAPKGNMTVSSQFAHAKKAMHSILPLIKKNHVIITHGNGPQVGNILIRVEEALGKAYSLPLSVAVAESEGEIGYIIEQSLLNTLLEKHFHIPVVSVLTQVIVDTKDRAFRNPTKPVGPFYSWNEAKLMKKKGLHVVSDSGRGWRRVVASPQPLKIVEADVIHELSHRAVVIAAGGGGIPVVKSGASYKGVDAVIDKDLASSCLAKSIKADILLILTDVPFAYKDFGRKNQQPLRRVAIREARKHIRDGHFAAGSMLPKVEAAIEFAETGGKAIITNISNAKKALSGKAGTVITK